MKKIITLLLAGMLCVSVAACSGAQETAAPDDAVTSATADTAEAEQVAEPEDLVVSETYYNAFAYDEDGDKSKDPVTVYEYELDSAGRPTKTTAVTDGQAESVKEMEYDAVGNVVRQTNFDAEGSKASVFEYTYDDNNNQTKFVNCGADGKQISVITYEYDENGYLISESYRSDDYAYTIRHENDADGKEIASVQYDADGSEISKAEYEYDSEGRLISLTQDYHFGDEASGSIKVEHEYDERGNDVKEVCYDADGSIRYSYDRVYKTVKELSGK